ncbi:MAG: TonB-dependent receptor [Alphaproteobacteria bacterium]|nr:TonB-dependent receptor [Alphaproteobacteria bacterium]
MATSSGSIGFRASTRATLLAAVSAASFSAGAAPALAQNEGPAIDASDEIIVSARRREESLQDVPIAVSAFSAEQLDDLGAIDLTDVEAITPNVTLETSRGTNTTLTAFIRGVGQQDPVAGFEAGVGVYIDDIYLNRPQAALLDIYDVERIEVLRGPQGTLYGRNTIGGAIKYVTRRLSDEPEAKLRLTGGNYGQIDAVGTFNLPLAVNSAVGDLLLGGSVAYLKRNGFGVNLTNGLDNYDKDILAGRLALEWAPATNFSLRITGDWTDDNSNPRQGHRILPFTAQFPVLENVFDTRAGLNTPEQSVVAKGVSGVAEWALNENFTVKNILAYREDRTESPIDFDSLPIADLDVPVIYDNSQFSEEFQVLYESDRLNGIVGFYYLDANALNVFDVVLDTTAALLSLPGVNAFTSSDVDTKTWSIFGDFTFDLTETISISAGGRYTEDERSMDLLRQRYFSAGFSPAFGGPNRPPSIIDADLDTTATFTDFSPRASVSWEPTDEHTLYASYSQGFKGGSFDPRCGANAAPDLDGDGQTGATDVDDQIAFCRFEPEEIDTYEIGWKSNLFGGRWTNNLALFYSDYKDVQVPGSIGIDADNDGIAETFAGVTTNAAEATLYGLELEGVAILAEDFARGGDSFSYQYALGYINAQFDEFIGRTGSNIADSIVVFQNTPSITAFSRLTYSTPTNFLEHQGDLSIYGSVSYRSRTNQFSYEIPALDQDQFALLNAGVYWTSSDGGLKLSLHGTNLTNQRYIVAGYDFVTSVPELGNNPLGLSGVQTAFYGDPRRFMGTIEVKF